MIKLIAIVLYAMMLWGIVKYFFSLKVLKEEKPILDKKYNTYGPFYDVDWENTNKDLL